MAAATRLLNAGRVAMVSTRRSARGPSATATAIGTKKDKKPKADGKRKRSASTAAAKSTPAAASAPAANTDDATPLLDLGPLEEGVLVGRPSERNRSPYVGDVRITSGPHAGRVAVTHLPNMDSGGKCRPGVRVLCRRQPGVTPDTVGQYGTPKCELVCQLIRCDEPENDALGGCWVSAHPTIGEKLVEALIRRGALDARLHAPVCNLETQVGKTRKVSDSASGGYRPDFRATHADGTATVLETKQVVDTDYDPRTVHDAAALQPGHPVYAPRDDVNAGGYERAGIFPWGKRGQKGPGGEQVVSARAIEHVRELAAVVDPGTVRGKKGTSGDVHAAVVLMAGRHDVCAIRANGAACPSFAAHLAAAEGRGVRVLGHRVRWGEGVDVGRAFDGGEVPVLPPLTEEDLAVLVPKPKPGKEKKPAVKKARTDE